MFSQSTFPQVAQLDLFGVSRRFPSIRRLNSKDKKKMKQQEKIDHKPAGDKKSDDVNCSRVGISLAVSGQLYSLPAKKSASLRYSTARCADIAVNSSNSVSRHMEDAGSSEQDSGTAQLKSDGETNNCKATDISLKAVSNTYSSLPHVKSWRESAGPARYLARNEKLFKNNHKRQ
jgi:hypothetical protein